MNTYTVKHIQNGPTLFIEARNRRVQAVLEKTKDGLRLKECGLFIKTT